MIHLPVTLATGGLSCLIYLFLCFHVVQLRRRQKRVIGDGGDSDLQIRIRNHGNFAEYIPLFLVMLAIIEAHSGSIGPVKLLGAAVVVSRLFYTIGAMRTPFDNPVRTIGIVSTFTLVGVFGFYALALAF